MTLNRTKKAPTTGISLLDVRKKEARLSRYLRIARTTLLNIYLFGVLTAWITDFLMSPTIAIASFATVSFLNVFISFAEYKMQERKSIFRDSVQTPNVELRRLRGFSRRSPRMQG
jgi:hypothetical protein